MPTNGWPEKEINFDISNQTANVSQKYLKEVVKLLLLAHLTYSRSEFDCLLYIFSPIHDDDDDDDGRKECICLLRLGYWTQARAAVEEKKLIYAKTSSQPKNELFAFLSRASAFLIYYLLFFEDTKQASSERE